MPGYPPLSDDLKELLSLLESNGVEFLVVGAHALAFHGLPRFTEDVDLFLSKSRDNIARLATALEQFGVPMPEASQQQMVSEPRGMIFLGQKPNRVDFLNFLDGVEYGPAFEGRLAGNLAGVPVFFISLEDYVATKKASGRSKDLADVDRLRKLYPDRGF